MNPPGTKGVAAVSHVFEILPVGTSPVRAPYFAFYEDGKEMHYSYADTWEKGMQDAFPPYAWPGGYAVAYFDFHDGAELCANCARAHYMETGIRLDADNVGDSDRAHYGCGIWCDGCDAEIVPPSCADCGADTFDNAPGYSNFHTPAFRHEYGDRQICARCMAQHVISGHAEKVAKGTYRLANDADWYAPGGTELWRAQ
jgi:hypothetical protein